MRKYLIAGLLVWLPLAATIWILGVIVSSMDTTLLLLPPSWRPDVLFGFHVPGFGLVMSVLILLATGIVAANIFGQRLLMWWEGLLNRIPIVRSIYSSVKQVSDTLLAQKGNSFRKVVLVEFPQRGQWTIGFVVGTPGPRIAPHLEGDFVTVYVSTAPNPTSGYVLYVRHSEIRELEVSVDDALKFHVSLGVVAPGANSNRPGLAPGQGVAPASG
ncbi:MAG TPA: DUF502 domain-containing protein [Burkholderiaceae bacterium]|nr:DUF502 domain-containing protein [Burkholderiaceae bacterium]